MTTVQFYVLGLAVVGHFLDSGVMRLPLDTRPLQLPSALGAAFITRFASDIPKLREKATALQSHDHDYAYTLNPLEFYPLVEVITNDGAPAVVAPIPTFLFRRITGGVFYDLCNEPGFSDAFGPAFQAYVGDALAVALKDSELAILAEEEFHDGRNRKDTVDWIISDETGHVFIECKAKRLRAEAKTLIGSDQALNAELEIMTSAVIQTYKAMTDAGNGLYPSWQPDGRPTYPMIVTLEEWYVFGDRILGPITERVRNGLAAAGLDPGLVDRHPFTVASISEFEGASQVMARVGIAPFMAGKTAGEAKSWVLHSYMLHAFRAETQAVLPSLFANDIAAAHGLPI